MRGLCPRRNRQREIAHLNQLRRIFVVNAAGHRRNRTPAFALAHSVRPQNGMASSGTSLLASKAGLVVLASLRTAAGFAPFHGAMYGSTRFTRFLSPYSPVL